MENVTRDVIADLWPVYVSGEASRDSGALIEAFLRDDPQYAEMLRESAGDPIPRPEIPSLAPDHELRTLARIKRRLSGPVGLLQLAIVFTGVAFGRIVSDTSFDVSPRNFIVASAIAVCFWIAFVVRLLQGRRAVLLQVRR